MLSYDPNNPDYDEENTPINSTKARLRRCLVFRREARRSKNPTNWNYLVKQEQRILLASRRRRIGGHA